jgi:hypothetical protein
VPVNCIPSPESPANRIVTVSTSSKCLSAEVTGGSITVLIGFLINPFQIDSQTFLLFSGRCEAILKSGYWKRGFLRTPKLVNWYCPGFPGNFRSGLS